MDTRKFVRGALDLAGGSRGLPWMCVPEIALFADGRKPALRFVLGRAEAANLRGIAEACALYCPSRPVATRSIGNTWSSLHPSDDPDASLAMVVVARDIRVADQILTEEADGDPGEAGKALGYPPCCVSALPSLASHGARWTEALVARSGSPPFPWAANRLATAWGGMCGIGELFPCSLRCEAANTLGLSASDALARFGLTRLALKLKEHGTTPVRVLADGGVVRAGDSQRGQLVEFI